MNYYASGYDPNYLSMYYPCPTPTDHQNYWTWGNEVQAPLIVPQRNIHVNPAFYQVPGPALSTSGKVIVNPKFFNVAAKQPAVQAQNTETSARTETVQVQAQPEKTQVVRATTDKNMLVVNKKYSWKKIDTNLKTVETFVKPHKALTVFKTNSFQRSSVKLKRQNSGKYRLKSRFRVDKRVLVKPKPCLNNSKIVHTKYKIVRGSQRTKRSSFRYSPVNYRNKVSISGSRSLTQLPSKTRILPTKSKLFSKNKWRPLSSFTPLLNKTSIPLRERKFKIKAKKKKETNGTGKRYYNTANVEKAAEKEGNVNEDFDVEITDQPVGLKKREPLGNLPSYITFS